MVQRLELFADGPADADDVWARVVDPRRWPGWTDVSVVGTVDPEPLEIGSSVTVRVDGRGMEWTVTTLTDLGDRLLEVDAVLADASLGVGVRVLPTPRGSRVVLAAVHDGSTRMARARFAVVGAGALRRRFDRWSATLVRPWLVRP